MKHLRLSYMSQIERLHEAVPHVLAEGVTMRPLFGDRAMLNLLEFERGARVPEHMHPHEQLGYMIEGKLVLAIDGHEYVLEPGYAYAIPGGIEHAAWSEEGCLVLDVFQPVRDDYRERVEGERADRH